jgi:hypothetical protein
MFLWPAAGCAHLAAVSTSPRVFSRPAPAHKAYANLPDRLRCAQTNYFAHLQPRMRNRWPKGFVVDVLATHLGQCVEIPETGEGPWQSITFR